MAMSRRIRAYKMDPESVAELLMGEIELLPLPPGTEVLRFGVDWMTNSAVIFVTNDAWEEVEPGASIALSQLTAQKRNL